MCLKSGKNTSEKIPFRRFIVLEIYSYLEFVFYSLTGKVRHVSRQEELGLVPLGDCECLHIRL